MDMACWIILVIFAVVCSAEGKVSCPTECQCEEGREREGKVYKVVYNITCVDIDGTFAESVKSFPDSAINLDISRSARIDEVDFRSLAEIKRLRRLSIDFAGTPTILAQDQRNSAASRAISSLEKFLKTHLSKIPGFRSLTLTHSQFSDSDFRTLRGWDFQVVNLTGNELTKFDCHVINSMPFLRHLDLSHNAISELRWGLDHNAILTLNLAGNKIEHFWSSFFQGLHALQVLNLKDNRLTSESLENLRRTYFRNLRTLSLDGNHIILLPENIFQGCRRLKYLNLARNLLVSIRRQDVRYLDNLKVLDLSQSPRLIYIEPGAFDDLKTLELLDLRNTPVAVITLPSHLSPAGEFLRMFVSSEPAANVITGTSSLISTTSPKEVISSSIVQAGGHRSRFRSLKIVSIVLAVIVVALILVWFTWAYCKAKTSPKLTLPSPADYGAMTKRKPRNENQIC